MGTRSSQLLLASDLSGFFGPPLVAMATAVALICGIPAAQHAVTRRLFAKSAVSPDTCGGCDCWDTVAIGPREAPGQPHYHSVYWNTNACTLAMFCLTVCHTILWYKAAECILGYARRHGVCSLRPAFGLLVALSIYPNYYSWWSHLMYLNEKVPMYDLIWHHAFYYLTDIVTAALDVHLTSPESDVTQGKLSVVFCIACSHLLGGCVDQFLRAGGTPAAVSTNTAAFIMFHSRNAGLLLPDIAHLLVCVWFLVRRQKADGPVLAALTGQMPSLRFCAKLAGGTVVLFCISQLHKETS